MKGSQKMKKTQLMWWYYVRISDPGGRRRWHFI